MNQAVICPNCLHEFRAIPLDVQTRMSSMEAALELAEQALATLPQGAATLASANALQAVREALKP